MGRCVSMSVFYFLVLLAIAQIGSTLEASSVSGSRSSRSDPCKGDSEAGKRRLRGLGGRKLLESQELSSSPIVVSMNGSNAQISAGHQEKFLSRKSKVTSQFDRGTRFHADAGRYAAIPLTDEYAYIHIWKSGGTTIQYQAPADQTTIDDAAVQTRDWVTFVRDPIDHFLSGWAESGLREYEEAALLNRQDALLTEWANHDVDSRVKSFLADVKEYASNGPIVEMHAHTHAFPQFNFVMDYDGNVDDHLKVLGDIREMGAILELVGFSGYKEEVKGRDASNNEIKKNYFKVQRDQLSDETVLGICEFVAIDYFLLNFEPPTICSQVGGPLNFPEI